MQFMSLVTGRSVWGRCLLDEMVDCHICQCHLNTWVFLSSTWTTSLIYRRTEHWTTYMYTHGRNIYTYFNVINSASPLIVAVSCSVLCALISIYV